jgi:hypothetical protein
LAKAEPGREPGCESRCTRSSCSAKTPDELFCCSADRSIGDAGRSDAPVRIKRWEGGVPRPTSDCECPLFKKLSSVLVVLRAAGISMSELGSHCPLCGCTLFCVGGAKKADTVADEA